MVIFLVEIEETKFDLYCQRFAKHLFTWSLSSIIFYITEPQNAEKVQDQNNNNRIRFRAQWMKI
jgi:hypothetical protein